MTYLKQSTAVSIAMGPFLDETDGKTAETGLTITQPDIRLKKNGGAWAQKNAAQTLSHEEAGWYEVDLDATDTDTLGVLIVAIHESGALPVWREFMVLPAVVYDSLVAGSDKLNVNVAEISDDSTAADNAELMFDGTGYAGGTIKLKTDQPIKKNTALANFMFKLVDETDGYTAETGVTSITAQVSIDGGAFGSLTNAGSISEVGSGWYKLDLAAADTNGNVLVFRFVKSGTSRVTEYGPVATSNPS